MEWYEHISIKLIRFVEAHSTDVTDDEIDRIKYGIEAFLVNIGKLPILFVLAYLFGILKPFSIMFLLYGLLRTFAGGFHAKTSLSCIIISIFSFGIMIYLSLLIYPNPWIKGIFYCLSIIILLIYAPADNEEKPIVNRKHRRRLRIASCMVASVYMIISYFTKDDFIANTLFYCVLFVSFFVSPIMYKLFNRRWRNYEYYFSSHSESR